MPPASRGVSMRLRSSRPQTPTSFRRNVSIQKPRDPRNFPSQARSRVRAGHDGAPPGGTPLPKLETEGHTTPFQRFRSRFTISTPQWLKDRPFLRTSIYSFFITVPISGFALMHFPLEPHRVLGQSMQPTINSECQSRDDTSYSPTWVLLQQWNPNAGREKIRSFKEGWLGIYNRGDLVAYYTPHNPDRVAVKRVVGVPGDTVIPLKGYEGGEDPVTIQYYQLWVEGDVNDRKKSVDSNYFGPISEAMVRGKVIAMWSPWWNIFGARRPDRRTDDWPAKRQKRVAEGAVYEASVNPDALAYLELFDPEKGENLLRKLRQTPEYMKDAFSKDDSFKRTMAYCRDKGRKVSRDTSDPDTRVRAQAIVTEIENLFGADELEKIKRKRNPRSNERWRPPEETEDDDRVESAPFYSPEAVTHRDELAVQREARERPAKAALEEMVKQTKQLAELKQKEMDEREQKDV